MKKSVIIAVLVLFGLWAVYFIGSGFTTAGDAWVSSAVVNEDGTELILTVGVAGSAGYVRDARAELDGDTLYLSFYHGFGGINGHIGVKNPITVELPENCTKVYAKGIYGADGPVCIAQKGADGQWQDLITGVKVGEFVY